MRLRIAALLAVLLAALAVGCGGGSHKTSTISKVTPRPAPPVRQLSQPPPACHVPVGQGRMGVCLPKPAVNKNAKPGQLTGSSSRLLGLDTSHFNFCSSAVGRPSFWIVAEGDGFFSDPCFTRVYEALHRAGIPHSTYVFLRTNLNVFAQADHFAARIREAGGVDSLPPITDAEANDAGLSGAGVCSYVHTFDNRLKADLHIGQVIDYSAQFFWPGCDANGNLLWDAAYGPVPGLLRQFSSVSFWQFTDGSAGPFPHCVVGVCGDTDFFFGSQAQLDALAHRPPPIPPVTSELNRECGELVYYRNHHRPGSLAGKAADDRAHLVASRVSCQPHPHYTGAPPSNVVALSLYGSCRELLAWRRSGRPRAGYAAAAKRRRVLMAHRVACTPSVHHY